MALSIHDPGVAAALARAAASDAAVEPLRVERSLIRFGTSSWTDPTLLAEGVFYPPEAHTPESRLRHYATRFSVVEVDSSYYALPARKNAELWARRTPAHFSFDIKAHALMTGQPSEVKRLPADIRKALPAALAQKARIYGKDLPAELNDRVWAHFRDAVEPLRATGKLGAVMLQYPRWHAPGARALEELADARARLADLPCTVEFRNALWFSGANAEGTLRFLEEQGLTYVMVDEPQGLKSSVPPVVAVTDPALAVVRMHGRRAAMWEQAGIPVVERFRYLYSAEELTEWVPRIVEAAERAREVHVLMNNCYANYGTTNALELAAMVRTAYAGYERARG
jgi:uncharacterized protein YecE (DUF72 family)